MAILKNLIVNGSSRFLNTAYFQDVSIAGSANFASISASGNITAGGNLYSTTGNLYLKNLLAIRGFDTWLRINDANAFTSGTYFGTNTVRTDGIFQVGANGAAVNIYYANNNANKAMTVSIPATFNGTTTTISNLVATTGNISTLNATNVNVTNNLRANHYDLQTVAQLGGSFYVSPTVKFPNSGTSLTVAKSGTTLTLTITDSSITSTTMAGIVWSANSRVKVSGTINGVVTGTMDGTVSSISTGSHTLTLSVSGENSGSVQASPSGSPYTASQFSDLSVMVYQRRDGSNDYRVGIWMNCYDVANSSSTIRIYGGSDANPNVMLGNLTSAGLGTVNNLTPTGWGLFAQNAFLHGKVVANGGLIGNWTIGTTGMYYNSDAPSSTSITMIPGGTTASTTSIGGSSGSKQWIFTGKNLFGIDTAGKLYASSAEISGKITANSGSIAGWRIESTYLASGTATAPAANTLLLSPAGTSSSYTVAGTAKSGWMITAGTTFGVNKDGGVYATSGKIGGFTIGDTTLKNGDLGGTTSVVMSTGTASSTAIGGSSGSKTWAFTASNKFGVTTSGELFATSGKIGGWTIGTSSLYNTTNSMTSTGVGLYLGTDGIRNYASGTQYVNITGGKITALGADIRGVITATSGTIGGVTANSSYGLYTNSKTSATSTNTGFLISKDGAIYLGAYNSTNKACPFQVTSAGVLTATGATINGTLTAGANSQIGPWHVTTTSIYKSNATMGASTSGASYFGNDGLSVTDKFKVTSAGVLTATGADVSGKITATEGAIGGFDITSTAIKTKNVAVTSNADNSISLSSADFTRTINSTPREGLRFAIGDKFGVTGDGTIYAGSANISGTLSAGANSTIGPWTVSKTSIYKGSNSINSTSSTAAYFGNDGLSIGGLLKIDARSGADTTISLGNTSSSNIAISSSGLMINNNTTPMATFNTEGIEMRGTDEQLLLDINTTGNPVTQSDSIVFSIQPIGVESTYIFKLNEDINENLRNVIGNVNVIVTFINGQEPSVLDTFTFNLNSDYNKNMGSGFTFNYKSKVSPFDDPYFSITCSGIVYGSECELVIDISWNYHQYPYNYTFGTRSKYGVRGIGSTIIGKNLENTNDNALVIGQYNKNGNYLFAVGNGDSDSNRSNAFTVDNYGVVGFSGVAMFGDPGSTFYVTSHTVVNNASVASQSYKDGTITIEKSGYYPLCVAGYNSNTRYLTPTRFYLSNQQSGSGSLNYMIFNPTSSARTGTCTMWVMWVKTT